MLAVPSVMGLTAAVALYPFVGPHALWFLTAVFTGLVLYAAYGAAGRSVEAKLVEARCEPGECAHALIVIGKLQSPGIAILHERKLELRPIVGSPVTVDLTEKFKVREGQWLPGKYLWGKRAFLFIEGSSEKRLAFAVPKSVGLRWSQSFQS